MDQAPVEKSINPDVEKLIRMQELDAEMGQLEELVQKTIPAQIKELEDNFANDQAKLKNFDGETAAQAKKKKELEAEVEDNKSKIAKAKMKLHEVKTNVEYRAILKETENFEERIRKIEDEQLDLMEKTEARASQRPAIAAQVDEDRARLNALKAEKDVDLKASAARLEKLKAERDELVTNVDPGILGVYDRIRSQRNGVGVARVVDGSCTGCYQIIPPQLFYLIRTSGEALQCPHCNRYLYHITEPKQENEETTKSGKKKKE